MRHSLSSDYGQWIRRKLIRRDDNLVTQQFVFFSITLPFNLLSVLRLCVRVCVGCTKQKIKDLLGLESCNRLIAVGNLLWHHQIHDQRLI